MILSIVLIAKLPRQIKEKSEKPSKKTGQAYGNLNNSPHYRRYLAIYKIQ